jgi:hypothetical protein
VTAREVLDGIKTTLAAATPGPWVYDKVSGVETVPEFDLHRFDIMPETVARIDLRHEDGEFIAAAPATVARLTTALEAVLELHTPDTYGECRLCEDGPGFNAKYPCPTVAAIEGALKEGQ